MTDRSKLHPRIKVNQTAALIDMNGQEHACMLLDVSADGFRARLDEANNPTELVELKTKSSLCRIEVRWATGLDLGGRIL